MADMDMRAFYGLGDCYMGISRSEGWGMPMREAAACGLPVITQCYSGMDDGHTEEWALVAGDGKLEDIPGHFEHIAGQWMKADVDEVATWMSECYNHPEMFRRHGANASAWIRQNQTFDHMALLLLDLIGEHCGAYK